MSLSFLPQSNLKTTKFPDFSPLSLSKNRKLSNLCSRNKLLSSNPSSGNKHKESASCLKNSKARSSMFKISSSRVNLGLTTSSHLRKVPWPMKMIAKIRDKRWHTSGNVFKISMTTLKFSMMVSNPTISTKAVLVTATSSRYWVLWLKCQSVWCLASTPKNSTQPEFIWYLFI